MAEGVADNGKAGAPQRRAGLDFGLCAQLRSALKDLLDLGPFLKF